MPIRWSTIKVTEGIDEIEELMNSIRPTLWQIREKAEELRRIPNLDLPPIVIPPFKSLPQLV
jgi:hypothetical protein